MRRLLRQAEVLGDSRHPLAPTDQMNSLFLELQRVARPCLFRHRAFYVADLTRLWEALHAGKVRFGDCSTLIDFLLVL